MESLINKYVAGAKDRFAIKAAYVIKVMEINV